MRITGPTVHLAVDGVQTMQEDGEDEHQQDQERDHHDNSHREGTKSTQGPVDLAWRVRLGMNLSWVVNISLLISKVAAFAVSRSYAVLASLIDSLVDLLAQILVALAARWEEGSASFHS
jgi:hypothetical protein